MDKTSLFTKISHLLLFVWNLLKFGMIAVAAILRRQIATIDITGAYVECELTEDDEVLMKLDPLLSALVTEIDPTAVPFRDDKGCLVVKRTRALYGCVQSARLWFEKLRDTLLLNWFCG